MIKHYPDMIQGSEEWYSARCGLLTASEMKLILTPTLKTASNDKERAHLDELCSQRINKYVEPHYIGDDMLRGIADEVDARILYEKHYAAVTEVGFITNDKWGFTLGYSPDALIGDKGAIECKSRRQKYQFQTIVSRQMPLEYVIQVQTGLLVSERDWIDFISYSAGMPMMTLRVYPDPVIQEGIIRAATMFHEKLENKLLEYAGALLSDMRLIPTERKIEEKFEMEEKNG